MSIVIGTPHTHNAGYYRNDNRASGGVLEEDDIKTCPHCQALIAMRRWREYGGFCRQCNAPVCGACGERMEMFGCEPFLRKLETDFGMAEQVRKLLEWGQPVTPGAIFSARRQT